MADADLIAKLGKCRLFEDLSKSELRKVAQRMAEDHFPRKTTILKEGERGMGFFFVVLDGGATVVQHGKEVAVLKQGDFFGEVTSLNGGPRTASVKTNEPLWVMRLTDTNSFSSSGWFQCLIIDVQTIPVSAASDAASSRFHRMAPIGAR